MSRFARMKVEEGGRAARISPFLLPTCTTCGGAMNLLCVEPHPRNAAREMRTFGCAQCGGQHRCDVPRQTEV